MTDRDNRTPEQKKTDIRAALDVLQNYVSDDGKLDARSLTNRLRDLEAENERLREAVRLLLCCPDIADNDHKDEETHSAERFARATLPQEPSHD